MARKTHPALISLLSLLLRSERLDKTSPKNADINIAGEKRGLPSLSLTRAIPESACNDAGKSPWADHKQKIKSGVE